MFSDIFFKDHPVPSDVFSWHCFSNYLQVLTWASVVTFASQRLINHLCTATALCNWQMCTSPRTSLSHLTIYIFFSSLVVCRPWIVSPLPRTFLQGKVGNTHSPPPAPPHPHLKLSLLSANFTTCAKLKAPMRKRRPPLVSPLRSSLLSFHSVVCNLDLVSFPSSHLIYSAHCFVLEFVGVCLSEGEFVWDGARQAEGFRRSRWGCNRKLAIVTSLWRLLIVDLWLSSSFAVQLFLFHCLSQSCSSAHFSIKSWIYNCGWTR